MDSRHPRMGDLRSTNADAMKTDNVRLQGSAATRAIHGIFDTTLSHFGFAVGGATSWFRRLDAERFLLITVRRSPKWNHPGVASGLLFNIGLGASTDADDLKTSATRALAFVLGSGSLVERMCVTNNEIVARWRAEGDEAARVATLLDWPVRSDWRAAPEAMWFRSKPTWSSGDGLRAKCCRRRPLGSKPRRSIALNSPRVSSCPPNPDESIAATRSSLRSRHRCLHIRDGGDLDTDRSPLTGSSALRQIGSAIAPTMVEAGCTRGRWSLGFYRRVSDEWLALSVGVTRPRYPGASFLVINVDIGLSRIADARAGRFRRLSRVLGLSAERSELLTYRNAALAAARERDAPPPVGGSDAARIDASFYEPRLEGLPENHYSDVWLPAGFHAEGTTSGLRFSA